MHEFYTSFYLDLAQIIDQLGCLLVFLGFTSNKNSCLNGGLSEQNILKIGHVNPGLPYMTTQDNYEAKPS